MRKIVLFMHMSLSGYIVLAKGKGIHFFKNIKSMTKLKLISTRSFDSVFVDSNYLVIR